MTEQLDKLAAEMTPSRVAIRRYLIISSVGPLTKLDGPTQYKQGASEAFFRPDEVESIQTINGIVTIFLK